MCCVRNWNDERAVGILSNCRQAMERHGKLLVVEPAMPPGGAASLNNLNIMVLTGGRDRTEAEHRALFDAAGFTLTSVISTDAGLNVVEASPV